MEEVAAKRPEEVRPRTATNEPRKAHSSTPLASPPQSALRADSSSIEEERGVRNWLKTRAKQMRAEMTPHEKAMWRLLHEGELVALNWRRQAVVGDFILDFVSQPARLVVEVDGAQHGTTKQGEHDAQRTAWLRTQGYRVLRFWNNEALKNRDGVWRTMHAAATETPARARMARWREDRLTQVRQTNAKIASSSMEEAPRSGGGGAPAAIKKEPHEAHSSRPLASPPQSALRADSSSIEEERGASSGGSA
jgi:very-short-patch-repair endonuclease